MNEEIPYEVYDNRKHPRVPQSLLTIYKHAKKSGWEHGWTYYSKEKRSTKMVHCLTARFAGMGRSVWATWEANVNGDDLSWKFKSAGLEGGLNLYTAKLTYTHFVTVIKNPQFTNIPQAEFLYRFPPPKG